MKYNLNLIVETLTEEYNANMILAGEQLIFSFRNTAYSALSVRPFVKHILKKGNLNYKCTGGVDLLYLTKI